MCREDQVVALYTVSKETFALAAQEADTAFVEWAFTWAGGSKFFTLYAFWISLTTQDAKVLVETSFTLFLPHGMMNSLSEFRKLAVASK